ncbi:cation diffusion facilitator family transporter [Clostridium sp. AN503]|jgi:cation diffusion facilitator family transporter|uniref:cation diffusion facilitator family transporter n=1 Tax=Clostridium sp. AN503 TaxID=3160598 RepID=UPI00345A1600
MTEFLVRTFVKDYKETENLVVRTRYGLLGSIVGICCNLILFTAKLLTGLMVNSISVMADAFNNLSDAASSIIGFVGVKMAEKPADEHHPFGHGRIEYISAFIVAFIVIQVGFSLFKTSLGKIFQPEELSFNLVSVGILVLSVLMKLWMAVFNRRLGKRINSAVMLATSADSLGDVGATSATILSILVFGIWHVNIDGAVGLIVSVLVMIAGVNIARDTLAPLIGEPIDPKIYQRISGFVEKYEGVVGSHDLIVHNYGPGHSMASIHAEVPSDVNIEISHEIIDKIERDAQRELGIFLVIHMDPVETNNAQVISLKEMAVATVKGLDARLTLHDFRIVEGTKRINLIFDLVVPREYTKQMQDALKLQVCQRIREQDERCYCVITTECTYQVERD